MRGSSGKGSAFVKALFTGVEYGGAIKLSISVKDVVAVEGGGVSAARTIEAADLIKDSRAIQSSVAGKVSLSQSVSAV